MKVLITEPARLASFYFAYFAYSAGLMAYFPVYLSSRGLAPAEIAFVLALPQAVRIVAPTGWGWIADRTGGARSIVAFSCAVTAVFFVALPYAGGAGSIAWMMALMSLLSCAALPLVEAISLASLSGATGRYGPIRVWGSVGFIAVVLAGGVWLDHSSIASLPAVLVALALGSVASALMLPPTRPLQRERPRETVPNTAAVRSLIGAGFCMAAAHGVLYAFLTLHLHEKGYSATAIGVLWTLGVLAEIVVFAYLPAIFRRHALSTILLVSLLLGVARFLGIAWLAGSLWVLVLAQLLHAATFGAFHAASVAAVQKAFPPGAHSRGQTLFSSLSNGAGGAAGALGAGWAWQAGGAGMAFSAGALAALAGAYFAYRLKREGL